MGSVLVDLAMKFLALALIVASASAKTLRFNLLAPPTELEYGFCDGSPEPLTFDVMSVTPFPILVQNGATITLEIQITLNQEVPVGSVVDLNLVLEGLIPIKIPCLEIEGLHIGSCHYDGDELLSTASDFLCPTYVPEGQACALPLGTGIYGGGDPLTVGPIESIPDILLPFLKGTVRAEATVTDGSGNLHHTEGDKRIRLAGKDLSVS